VVRIKLGKKTSYVFLNTENFVVVVLLTPFKRFNGHVRFPKASHAAVSEQWRLSSVDQP